jgi:hypothetical protein
MLGLLLVAMVGLIVVVAWAMFDAFAIALVVALAALVGGVVLGASMTG